MIAHFGQTVQTYTGMSQHIVFKLALSICQTTRHTKSRQRSELAKAVVVEVGVL